jgi:hypothetical protein
VLFGSGRRGWGYEDLGPALWIEEGEHDGLIRTSLMPETLRSLVGDGSLEPPTLNASPTMIYRRHKLAKQAKERAEKGQVVEEVEEVIRPPRKKVGPVSAMEGGLTRAVSAVVRFPDPSDARDSAAVHFRVVAVSRVLLHPVSGHPTMFGI